MQSIRVLWRSFLLALHFLLGLLLTPLVTHQDQQGYWLVNHRVASWWLGRVAHILRIDITTSGTPPTAPALVAANHISWLDIVILGHLLPTCFLSKAEVRDWPLIGWQAMRAGTLFIRRGGGEAGSISETMAKHLQHEGMLTLFPEGRTTDGHSVHRFFPRLFAAAVDSGTPVAPVALHYHINGEHDARAPYIDDQSLAQNLLGLLRRPGSQVHVHFCPPIPSRGMERKALAAAAQTAVVQALESRCDTSESEHPDA